MLVTGSVNDTVAGDIALYGIGNLIGWTVTNQGVLYGAGAGVRRGGHAASFRAFGGGHATGSARHLMAMSTCWSPTSKAAAPRIQVAGRTLCNQNTTNLRRLSVGRPSHIAVQRE